MTFIANSQIGLAVKQATVSVRKTGAVGIKYTFCCNFITACIILPKLSESVQDQQSYSENKKWVIFLNTVYIDREKQ